jgi:Arc/MetJ-type ribon-helix-helix transcriptional regulator
VKETSISLPDDLVEALEAEVERRCSSVSDVLQTALREHLGLSRGGSCTHERGEVAHSGHRTTARDMEEFLEREWGDDAVR